VAAKECLQHFSQPFDDDDPERLLAIQGRLEVGLDRLDEDALALLWNRFVLEETSAEVASRLNVTAVSVRMRLSRLVAGVRESDKSTDGQLTGGYDLDESGNA
jgi:hypothetical protein